MSSPILLAFLFLFQVFLIFSSALFIILRSLLLEVCDLVDDMFHEEGEGCQGQADAVKLLEETAEVPESGIEVQVAFPSQL